MKDKLFIDFEKKIIGGITTKKGFEKQIEKLKKELRGDLNESC